MAIKFIDGKFVDVQESGLAGSGQIYGNNSFSGIQPFPTTTNTVMSGVKIPTGTVDSGLNGVAPIQTYAPTTPAPAPTPAPAAVVPPPIVGTPAHNSAISVHPAAPTGTTTPIAPPAPAGSVSNILNGFNPSGYSATEQAVLDAHNKTLESNMNATFDPNAVYRQNLQMYQAQIDAINNIYNDQLNQSRIQNAPEFQSRIGSQTAMAARGGLLGSDPGKAMVDNQVNDNNKVQASQDAVFRAERNDAINKIYGKVTDSVTAAKAKFDETKAKSTEDYIAGIKARPEERKKQLSNAVKMIYDTLGWDNPDITMTEDEIKKFADKLGVSVSQFNAEFETQVQAKTAELNKQKLAEDKAQAEIDQTVAQTAKTKADTALVGKMTPDQKANLAEKVREFGLTYALDKWKAENPTLTNPQVTQFINTQMATPEFKGMSKEQKADFILANGGTPADYGY